VADPLLVVENLHSYYGESHILQGVSLEVPRGTVVSLLGRNGAGKTTTLRSLMGLTQARRGTITFRGRSLVGVPPYKISRAGMALVHEKRNIFPSLTVQENLTIAARVGSDAGRSWTLDRVYATFPRLRERRENGGAQLSGGEQQMLAIARALLTNPDLLLLDEPSEGLAPLIVGEIRLVLEDLKSQGTTMLLVEQNVMLATALADASLVLGKGMIRWRGRSEDLRQEPAITKTWLGV
jgi:branched-chain amino acid transport system ATP-binding protein